MKQTNNFSEQVVVITGASGNLGTELCLAFGQRGAKIVCLDISQAGLAHLSALLTEKQIIHFTSFLDVAQNTDNERIVEKIIQHFGRLDIWVNNAGITHIQRFTNIPQPLEVLERVMRVNFFGAVQPLTAALPHLIQQKGQIINISSAAGFAPLVGRTAYSASKHALHGFFESLREELKAQEVHVLMVCPSFIGQSASAYQDPNHAQAIHQPKKILGSLVLPQVLAEKITAAATARQNLLIAGRTAWLSYWLSRLFPNWYAKIMRQRLEGEG